MCKLQRETQIFAVNSVGTTDKRVLSEFDFNDIKASELQYIAAK